MALDEMGLDEVAIPQNLCYGLVTPCFDMIRAKLVFPDVC